MQSPADSHSPTGLHAGCMLIVSLEWLHCNLILSTTALNCGCLTPLEALLAVALLAHTAVLVHKALLHVAMDHCMVVLLAPIRTELLRNYVVIDSDVITQ